VKAAGLPDFSNTTSSCDPTYHKLLVEEAGFEQRLPLRTDNLQSVAFNHSATPPQGTADYEQL